MLDQFVRQNRWWIDASAVEADRHLARMREARFPWMPRLPFRFQKDAIYTLRGPRQVGKSTILKQQIKALIDEGWPPSQILYLDVELAGLERGADLVAALRSYLEGARSQPTQTSSRYALFLDEVTRVENWAGALRGLVDNDELRDVTLVATGSHTRDLRAGGERLPGRRGGSELDWELLPLSFREYVALVSPALELPPVLQSLSAEEIRATQWTRTALRPQLSALFERYLAVGGFLSAVNDDAIHGALRAELFQTYREAIIGEFTRAGHRESYLREVVGWIADHLGQEFDYRGLAADTDIGSKDTARSYVDDFEDCYAGVVSYRTPSLTNLSPAFRGPKKIHALDPLVWHLIRAWAAADPDPWSASVDSLGRSDLVGHLVESVLMVHARRAFGERVYYWRPDKRREIDLVVANGDSRADLVESKYRQTISEQEIRCLTDSGGGIVVTRGSEGYLANSSAYSIPAADLLVLIGAPSLCPCRL